MSRTTMKGMLTAVATAVALSACSGGATVDPIPLGEAGPGDPVRGATVYVTACATCHGRDLQGIPGLGSGLAPSEFVAGMSEEELAAFIAVGREADHPDNMQGIAMPPRGGNANLTDQELRDVAAYLKGQQ